MLKKMHTFSLGTATPGGAPGGGTPRACRPSGDVSVWISFGDAAGVGLGAVPKGIRLGTDTPDADAGQLRCGGTTGPVLSVRQWSVCVPGGASPPFLARSLDARCAVLSGSRRVMRWAWGLPAAEVGYGGVRAHPMLLYHVR